jgi:cytoskeletal protein CcmA (bactofilin family)
MFSRSTDSLRLPEISAASGAIASPAPASPAASAAAALAPATFQTGSGQLGQPGMGPASIAKMVPPAAPPVTVVPLAETRAAPGKVSVIGNDLTILGQGITIISKGSLQLDGAIQGNLHGTEILVGEKGRVEGTIAALSVVIRGTVNGIIKAQRVALQEGARVDGEIHHQTLVLDAKAHFEGKVRRPQNPDDLIPNLDPSAHDMKSRAS